MIGPVIIDLLSIELSTEEREILQHPLVGGVILFTRNYQSPEQIAHLCREIRQSRSTPILITVDHEGGRVQRFRQGMTRLPSMESIGAIYADFPEKALQVAESSGWLMAAELLSLGIDLSYAPVLDLNKQISSVIGDRAFHRQSAIVVKLALAFMQGMRTAGMAAVGKHFPGHGSVVVDSHTDLPIDERTLDVIQADDMVTFNKLIQAGIPALMPAHILFPAIDSKPVGFSKFWLQEILRKQLRFNGVIISDDLNMEGAKEIGNHVTRARVALDAGCDIILICNNRPAMLSILEQLPQQYTLALEKFKTLQGQFSTQFGVLQTTLPWKKHHDLLMNHLDKCLI